MTNRFVSLLRPLRIPRARLAAAAALLLAMLAPRAASAIIQSAELLRTPAYFYGRFEARLRFAPGEGVVSSFFLWKNGSSSTTSWNELDYEKINSTCRLQTNIWTGKGTQSAQINTPAFDICADYHTYAFEWTPDYIAWLIDGTQVRRVTGSGVTEYTQNASQGMTIHFNIWAGDSSFGGTLNPSILPVRQFISWVQYSSYANGAFQVQWREEFNASTKPSDWDWGTWGSPFNLSMHSPANVNFVNGIAVLSMTADGAATGFTGTPPADTSGGGGASGTGGATGAGGSGAGGTGTGAGGRGGAGGTGAGGRGGTGGSASPGSGGTSSTGGATGAGGAAGSGAGGAAAGTAGNGAGGVTAGAGGNGTGGAAAGTAGSGTGGSSGVAGATGTGGTAGQDPIGTGGAGIAGTSGSGQAGSTGQTGGDGGCSCDVGAANGGSAVAGLLLLAATAGVRRRRSARPPRGPVKR